MISFSITGLEEGGRGSAAPVVHSTQGPLLKLVAFFFAESRVPDPNPDPDPHIFGPDPLVKGMDPDPDPSVIKQK
jgi:hypothetical protein